MKNFIEVGKTEEEQAEQIKKWVKKNGAQVIIGVSLGLSGIWGVNYYNTQQYKQTMQARSYYLAMVDNPSDAKAIDALKEKYADNIYSQQANLILAKQAVSDGNYQGALDYLLPFVDNEDKFIAHTVKLRIANLYLEMGNPDQALSILKDNDDKEFNALYNHVKGDAYFVKNDLPATKKHYQLALAQLPDKSQLKNLIKTKLSDID
ncbi:Mlr7403 protein [Bathymodiolus thermophilus thioautotrophic gill symbiont]|uniref:Ancillary SecYEG translocon subunit n=1 Tax=Bathymodiolus thermophilus thioautotrophic gill symbiont TaxID=2360 RepID=A0A1J5TXB4_9GAMM|nr:tetratricopeptide repeat protein [Bathymodiolus thermophilus thioautotrophic gill symbiont]AYQ56439.1 putative membrane-associated protein with TPR-like domain [Bathymodiolus thermophilus thioautotrophic gill symbiont]OIR25394.1 hypothetical protein BGC33_06410 [Bathymodiolus thermophilus thioautotrophic gill symbiont]CAB5496233.1 hypothetical protein THERMOS_463 [Bathymodiolus thermophilus thioautotrophic gill symbiont]CAB5506211.1 hypothetical protein THERMOT_2293 [Bathymodiolus thermophil